MNVALEMIVGFTLPAANPDETKSEYTLTHPHSQHQTPILPPSSPSLPAPPPGVAFSLASLMTHKKWKDKSKHKFRILFSHKITEYHNREDVNLWSRWRARRDDNSKDKLSNHVSACLVSLMTTRDANDFYRRYWVAMC